MAVVNFLERVAGAVAGAASRFMKARLVILFDPADFDVDDYTPPAPIQTGGDSPGIASSVTRVRGRAGAGGNVPSTRTLTGDGDVLVDGDTSPHNLSADRMLSTSATAIATPSRICKRDDTGRTGLNGFVAAATETLLVTQIAHPTAAGGAQEWSGQAAASGAFSGGALRVKGGTRGDSEHWNGDVEIAIGTEDDNTNTSAAFALFANDDWSGTPFLKIVSTSSGVTKITAPDGIWLAGYPGFNGNSPPGPPPTYAQTYSLASRTVPTSTGINNAQLGSVYASVADLNATKQAINALIDDLQAYGLLS